MNAPDRRSVQDKKSRIRTRNKVRRAFQEFLGLPTLIIVGFLVLAVGVSTLDRISSTNVGWLDQLRQIVQQYVFTSPESTSDLLSTIATSIITVTSVTFSILLLAVQQTAATMTFQVIGQFLRRKLNQAYFGFFVGLALYTLFILSTISDSFVPLFGATLALLLTAVALYFLILLIYNTMDQMRPSKVIEAIEDYTLAAREQQLPLLRKTRRTSRYTGASDVLVTATDRGYVAGVDIDRIGAAAGQAQAEVEIVLHVSIGSYVAFGDVLAVIKAQTVEDARRVGQAMQGAIHLEHTRDQDYDAALGITQITTIAWTAISTSKQDPSPGVQAVRSLRDLLARWCDDEVEAAHAASVPVVYPDNVLEQLMQAFESLAVVSSESMQHQVFANVVDALAIMFNRISPALQQRAEDIILRILSALGDHVLTAELDAGLAELIRTLKACGRHETAKAVQAARDGLATSVGKLNSRSTRVPSSG